MTPSTTRRDFLATTAAAAALSAGGLFAAENSTLKLGLVGCGGRGSGAAEDALRADPNVKLVAVGDLFQDILDEHLNVLKAKKDIADRITYTPDSTFLGFDAYKKVIDACDVVILATTPHFRPQHLEYAVAQKKHVFFEKPVAVDATGVRKVIDLAKKAKENNTLFASGFCYRYDLAKRATVQKIHDGAVGDIKFVHVNYLTGELWSRKCASRSPTSNSRSATGCTSPGCPATTSSSSTSTTTTSSTGS